MWEGDYHAVSAPHRRHGHVDFQLASILGPLAAAAGLRGSSPCNLGGPDDYRVPDQAYFRADHEPAAFERTTELVVEVVSPGDESRQKFEFYFQVGVGEVLLVDPDERTVEWFGRSTTGFEPVAASKLLGIAGVDLVGRIDWPR